MKTLYMIRHAKSSWEFDVSDKERPLNARGLRDADLIGEKLGTIVKSIDKVLSSPAKRAHHTAQIVVKHLSFPEEILEVISDLYDFEGNQVLDVIKNCDDNINDLMIFGHNHAFTSIVNMLGSERIDNVPTAGVVVLQFDVEKWQKINVGKTLLILFPKALR
ncbi:histidine phosphatase family protein [Aquimarina sp. U1-2]|uniref:SixA phosphatase family protein n=1 Tax=Aquimarina sp. U1-2 TaxID=2823141 RepID=UPI001AECA281|nr:histidine phosphatase family protein [Aquimarina sp. U1-2]MBP2833570.1 histidine phosphatase family protein [Aquimarina sp. U1-2]